MTSSSFVDIETTTKLSSNTVEEKTNTHAVWAHTHSKVLVGQHNKPKPHFTLGLAGIY